MTAQRFTDSLFTQQISEYLKPAVVSKEQEEILASYLSFWQTDLIDDHHVLIDVFNDMAEAHITSQLMLTYIENSNRLLDLGKPDLLISWSKYLSRVIRVSRSIAPVKEKILYVHDMLTANRISPKSDIGLIIDGDFDFEFNDDGIFYFRALSPVDIKLFIPGDTLIIRATKGKYNTKTHLWEGTNGTIFWDRFPDINDKAFAKFGGYLINTTQKEFRLSNVSFTVDYNTVRLNNLKGELQMRFSFSPGEQGKNPKFFAYQDLDIKDILPQTVFEGKFRVEGRNIYLNGNLDFMFGNKKVIRTYANTYTVTPTSIKASKVSMDLYLDQEKAIHHPELDMIVLFDSTIIQSSYPYLAPKVLGYDRPRLLSFIRTNGSYGSQPFHDDYHKVNIYTAEMVWTFDSSVYFVNTMNRLEDTSYFESYFYLDEHL